MRWGLVTTTNAATGAILDFAAHHLSLGAARLWLFLDAPNPDAAAILSAHPEIRVIDTDAAYWASKGTRPEMHQPRQAVNARHAYNRSKRLDWLGHVDIDEFLWPEGDLAAALDALPAAAQVARIRPVEALAPGPDGDPHYFKATPIARADRRAATEALYPDYAAHLDDGFLSHVAGKIFVRCGLEKVRIKIHNAIVDGVENPGQVELPAVSLCHLHAEDWQTWRARFDYRLEQGAYRASLGRTGPSGMNLHDLFRAILTDEGEAGLRRFHDTLCTASRPHLAALQAQGLLHRRDLQLSAKRHQYFPAVSI